MRRYIISDKGCTHAPQQAYRYSAGWLYVTTVGSGAFICILRSENVAHYIHTARGSTDCANWRCINPVPSSERYSSCRLYCEAKWRCATGQRVALHKAGLYVARKGQSKPTPGHAVAQTKVSPTLTNLFVKSVFKWLKKNKLCSTHFHQKAVRT